MKTGAALFEEYQKLRDYSGSETDSYAQDLCTFLMHAQQQGKAEVFYQLLERAEKENKQISFIEPSPEILYDDYLVEDLILKEKQI
ncbi:MAG: hypothetical protein WKF68_03730 [Daejeonella sp.]